MSKKTDSRRATTGELARDARAEAILEFAFNDEEEALCNADFALRHQEEMPAVQEFLREMIELDARPATANWH
jgi:hypothetical protein